MDGVNYQTLVMMVSDAPHYKSSQDSSSEPATDRSKDGSPEDPVLEFFQSQL